MNILKIERTSDNDYKLYIYSKIIDKDNFATEVKELVKNIQKKLKLNGFYKVTACFKTCGLFLHLVKIEDSFYKNSLDLRVVMEDDLDIYFKTKDYFILKDINTVKYFEDYYYGLVDDSFDGIIEKVEFGDFVFGSDITELLNKSNVI